ncbi:MAG: hypothetical protein NE328_12230 [Lentisphaeraceae bacterium]|nr:hypothetical protein [Lentisphaeraceae bacterium]
MLRLFLISCVFLSFAAIAEENATIKVKAGKFLYKTDLPGLILSSEVEKIKIDAKQWQNWVLVKAATHGQFVKKGDVLALFESKEYEEALEAGKRNLETQKANLLKSQTLFEISMKKMDFEKKKAQLDAEAAQKLAMIYKEKGHAQAKANFEQDLIDAQNSLEYQKEELSQLKKMYDEDKITEETEEIVLKRQQNYVKSLSRRMKSRELAVEEAVNVKLPNELFNSEYKKAKAELDAEKIKIEWEIFALTERLKLESQTESLKKAEENHVKLEGDKKFFEMKASMDGLVMYGAVSAGKWTNQFGTEYPKGKTFQKGVNLFSLVNPNKFKVTARADYTEIQYVDDRAAYFTDIPGKGVQELSLKEKASVPNRNVFKVTFDLKDSKGVFHGTECKVQLIKEIGAMVISVPQTSVHQDEMNPTKSYVNVVKGGNTEKTYVETGLTYNGKTIITSGLSEGVEVKTK